jgi:hypothetical protein
MMSKHRKIIVEATDTEMFVVVGGMRDRQTRSARFATGADMDRVGARLGSVR